MPQRQEPAVCAAVDGMNRARSPLWQRSLSWTILAGATIFFVSCGGEPRLALPANPSPTPPSAVQAAPLLAATPAIVTPTLGEVIWTTEVDSVTDEPADEVTRYPVDAPRLVAATEAAALPAGSHVQATWTYNNTPLEPLTTELAVGNAIDGQWMSFHLSRDPNTPWPSGLYEIAITLDGALLRESSIEVVDSE